MNSNGAPLPRRAFLTRLAAGAALGGAGVGCSALAWAEDAFPARNIEILVPWGVGGGPTLTSVSPSDRADQIGVFSEADTADLDRAVESATAAAQEWASWSPIRRARSLAQVARAIEANSEEFAQCPGHPHRDG